jgi:Fe-S cluster biogenesis protein NfuA
LAWPAESVNAALEEARALVRSDGADLELVEANEKAARIVLRLDVTNASCETGACVMPGEILEPLVAEAIARHIAGEFELKILDPRRA